MLPAGKPCGEMGIDGAPGVFDRDGTRVQTCPKLPALGVLGCINDGETGTMPPGVMGCAGSVVVGGSRLPGVRAVDLWTKVPAAGEIGIVVVIVKGCAKPPPRGCIIDDAAAPLLGEMGIDAAGGTTSIGGGERRCVCVGTEATGDMRCCVAGSASAVTSAGGCGCEGDMDLLGLLGLKIAVVVTGAT